MGVITRLSSCQLWTFTEVMTSANLTTESDITLTLRGEIPGTVFFTKQSGAKMSVQLDMRDVEV